MSRRRGGRSSTSSLGDVVRLIVFGLLLVCGFVLFVSGFLLLVIWPLFFLYAYLKKVSGDKESISVEPERQTFWLNADEKKLFRRTSGTLSREKQARAQQIAILNSLPEARHNKDGSYDKRGQAGRDRGEQQSKIDLIESKISGCERDQSLLSKSPIDRFNAWLDKRVRYKTSEVTVLIIVLGIPVYEIIALTCLGYSRDASLDAYVFFSLTAPLQAIDGLISIQGYLPFFFAPEYIGFEFSCKHWAAVMVVPPFLTIIPYLMFPPFYKNRVARRAKAPPEVCMENIDTYERYE